MRHIKSQLFLISLITVYLPVLLIGQKNYDAGFTSLFNGKDLTGWIAPDTEHTWKVIDGILDYSAMGGHLVTEKEYEDYIFQFEWRFKRTVGDPYTTKLFNPDGTQKVDAKGEPMTLAVPNADSGVYTRGTPESQVNLWCWPCGSGQLWNYHKSTDPELRRGALPLVNADKPVGEWNQMQITMRGDSIHVVLNGKVVINSRMPGTPAKGPIVLQHHGKYDKATDTYSAASALIQFRNMRIKELKRKAECPDEGWTRLLDKDFDGMRFKFADGTENKGTFKMKDGMLLCSGKPSGYMYTEKSYKNYILEAELAFDRPEGLTYWQDFTGNSGILAHVSEGPGLNVWPRSLEVQGYNRHMGRILLIPRDLVCTYETDYEAIHDARNPLGQWNKLRIETDEDQMKVYLNGTLVSTISSCELSEGSIAWQSEGASTRWRNIRIKQK